MKKRQKRLQRISLGFFLFLCGNIAPHGLSQVLDEEQDRKGIYTQKKEEKKMVIRTFFTHTFINGNHGRSTVFGVVV